MSYINVAFDLANTDEVIIPLDRWSDTFYTLQVETGGTVLVEATLGRGNREELTVWATINDRAGAAMAAQGVGIVGIEDNPYEAFRITATGAVTGRLMQTGAL